MSRGKRYSSEPKLNIKKVIAVILIMVVIAMFIIAIRKLIQSDENNNITVIDYFTLYSNGKWGVIDSNANIVIEPTYDEMIIIPDKSKDVFICTENVDYENNTFGTKVINAKNKEILNQYNTIQAIENYDQYNNLWYEEDVLKFEENGKYGLIDFNGKILAKANFDQIDSLKGIKGALITVQGSNMGLIDTKGKEIIPNQYSEIKSLGKDTNLYIVKNQENNYGIYGKLETKYQEIKPLNHKTIYCVKEKDQYKVIDQEGKEISLQEFDDITEIKDNIIVYTKHKKYGAYDITKGKNIKCQYDELQYTSNNFLIARKDNAYGIIDMDNVEKQKIEYTFINYYEDAQIYELEPNKNTNGENIILNKDLQQIATGIVNEANDEKSYMRLWTGEGYQYCNLNGEKIEVQDVLVQDKIFLKKENGKYGFVDKEGNTIVECIYDDAKEQNQYGYAAIKKDGKWGAIDTKGNVVCETIYNLDENLLIDFIGKYHLGKDINLLYYTEQ